MEKQLQRNVSLECRLQRRVSRQIEGGEREREPFGRVGIINEER